MLSVARPLWPDLEILHQASAGDLAAIDLLHVDILGTEEPRHQHLQVVQEITVNLWMKRPNDKRVSFTHRDFYVQFFSVDWYSEVGKKWEV